MTVILTVAVFSLATTGALGTDTESVLFTFGIGGSGNNPQGLIQDSVGNFYGTTESGGGQPCNCGAVFELSPASGGGWTYTTLYGFSGANNGTYHPGLSGLTIDKAGNLYGSAYQTGTVNSNCSFGCGFVYELSPASGGWIYSTLYSFQGGNDGANPIATVALDASGNVYGTTTVGGSLAGGTVFKLSHASGTWKKSVIHNLKGSTQGASPAGVVLDSLGNVYGVTTASGAFGFGTAFELLPPALGKGWSFKLLHSFAGAALGDGAFPLGTLIFDKAGSLYGTTYEGGSTSCGGGGGCGTVYTLKPTAKGAGEHVLHSFDGTDGYGPIAGLAEDGAGNLYGPTTNGNGNCGTAFELSHNSGGWNFSSIYNFPGDGTAGCGPAATLVIGAGGNLYGVTTNGGSVGFGVAFELQP